MGELKYNNGLLMAGLFGFAILMFAINFAADNESQINLDPSFNDTANAYSSNLYSFSSAVDSSADSFNQDNQQGTSDTSTSGEQFKVTTPSPYSAFKTTADTGFNTLFGKDTGFAIFLITLGSIVLLTILRYGYKTWFGKNPD